MAAKNPVNDTVTYDVNDTVTYDRAVKIAKARGWRPESNDTRTGILVAVRIQHSDYPKPDGSDYPVLVYENIDRSTMRVDGTFFAAHAFTQMMQEQLMELKPPIGSIQTLTHIEKVTRTADEKAAGKNDYHDWHIVMGDGTDVVIEQAALPWA